MAVACLIAVGDEEEAAAALRRVPGLADASAGWLRQVARWLRQLYPADRAGGVDGGPVRWWGSVQPDLLAEQHAAAQLADDPGFAAGLTGLVPGQAAGVLTVLARGHAHDKRAAGLVTSALRADLPGLGIPAVDVAIRTGGPMGAILADVLTDADAPLETLIEIEEAIPFPTVALAQADVTLTRRITQMLPGR